MSGGPGTSGPDPSWVPAGLATLDGAVYQILVDDSNPDIGRLGPPVVQVRLLGATGPVEPGSDLYKSVLSVYGGDLNGSTS